jgi:hypothetical protein
MGLTKPTTKQIVTNPTATNHFKISIVKSVLRLVGCSIIIVLGADGLRTGVGLLALAEVFGIVEELV